KSACRINLGPGIGTGRIHQCSGGRMRRKSHRQNRLCRNDIFKKLHEANSQILQSTRDTGHLLKRLHGHEFNIDNDLGLFVSSPKGERSAEIPLSTIFFEKPEFSPTDPGASTTQYDGAGGLGKSLRKEQVFGSFDSGTPSSGSVHQRFAAYP